MEERRAALHILKSVNKFREYGDFCDLILEVNNTKFFVHRLVVAAWSAPLKNLLHSDQACTQHIQISYDKPDVFEQVICFLYTGAISDDVPNIPGFLLVASTFQIQMLINFCSEQLKSNTSVDNVISLHHLALKFHLQDVELHCVNFLREHLAEVAQRQELRELSPSQINHFLGSEFMSKIDPEMKLFLIISWLTEDVPGRRQFLVLLLGHIDWSVVAKDFLEEISQTENFFTSNPSSLYLLLQTLHSSSISLGPYCNQFHSLREQYSYLLSNVVSSSVELGSGLSLSVQPIRFSLISTSPAEEQELSHLRKQSIKGNEDEFSFSEGNEDEVHDVGDELIESDISEKIGLLDPSVQECSISNAVKINVTDTHSKQKDMEMSKNDSGTNMSAVAEGSTRRKCLRPRKIVTKPTETTDKTVKVAGKTSNRKKSEKIPFNTTQENDKNRPARGAAARKGSREIKSSARKGTEVDSRPMRTSWKRKNEEELQKQNSGNMVEQDISRTESGSSALKTVKEETMTEEEMKGNQQQIPENVKKSDKKAANQVISGQNRRKRKSTQIVLGLEENSSGTEKTVTSSVKKRRKLIAKKEVIRKKKDETDIHKCLKCNFTASSQTEMDAHVEKSHKGKGNCLFCCSLCSFKSKQNKEYYDHIRKSHFPGPPYQCDADECSYSTSKLPHLMSHRKLHSDQRPFVCDICLMAFRSKNNLYAHFKIHSDEKKFKCPDCSRTFKLKNTLDQHMVIHSDLRPYLCDLCGFSTKFQSHLISHKRTHTGEVYKCNFLSCTYSTPKKSQLKSHMRSHLGIRRHVCSTCGKAFVEKSHLIRHERIHSSEKGYVCSLCEYSSTRADKLREHVQKHHTTDAAKPSTTADPRKTGSLRKERQTKNSKVPVPQNDSSVLFEPNQDSLIEIVVVKDSSTVSQSKSDLIRVPTSLTAEDIDATLSHLQFQAMQVEPQAGNCSKIMSSSAVSMPELSINPQFKSLESSKNEKELSTAEILARMGLPVSDTGSDGLFSSHGQMDGTNKHMAGSASIVGPASNKTAATDHSSQHSVPPASLNVPPYSVVMTQTGTHFSAPSAPDMNTFDFPAQQQSYYLPSAPHPLVMVPSVKSSLTTSQQLYPIQQPGTQQQQLLPAQQQELPAQPQQFSHVGDVSLFDFSSHFPSPS